MSPLALLACWCPGDRKALSVHPGAHVLVGAQGIARLYIFIHVLTDLCQLGRAVAREIPELAPQSSDQTIPLASYNPQHPVLQDGNPIATLNPEFLRQFTSQAGVLASNPSQYAIVQDGNPMATLRPEILRQFASEAPDAALQIDPLSQYLPQRDALISLDLSRLSAANSSDQHQPPPPTSGASLTGDAALALSQPSSPLTGLDPAVLERLQQIYAEGSSAIGHGLPSETLNLKPSAPKPVLSNDQTPQSPEGFPGDPSAVPTQLRYPGETVQATDGVTASNLPAGVPGPYGDSLKDPAGAGQDAPGDETKPSAIITQDPYSNIPKVPARLWPGRLGYEVQNPAGVNVPMGTYGDVLKRPAKVWQSPYGDLLIPAEAGHGSYEHVPGGGQGLPGNSTVTAHDLQTPVGRGIPAFPLAAPGLAPSASQVPGEVALGPSAQPQAVSLPFCQGKLPFLLYADPTNRRGYYYCGGRLLDDTYSCCRAGSCFNLFCWVWTPSSHLLTPPCYRPTRASSLSPLARGERH